MTNNKQQTTVDAAELALKLYPFSGDSVRNAFITGYNKAKEIECVLLCAKEQKSIELPSDEEIWDRADEIWGRADSEQSDVRHLAFMQGAKWMRDKIQGGKK